MLRLLILLVALAVPGFASAEISVARDIRYGAHPDHRYDVYFDEAVAGAPVIIMLHGGGWVRGRKEAAGVWRAKSAYFVPRGYVFVSVETRLLDDGADPRAQAEDLARAVAHIRARAASWGGDPGRVILMGHSAGAHVAALVGADPMLRSVSGPLRGVVSLDTAALDLEAVMAGDPPRLFWKAFGEDPDYWEQASPLARLDAGAPPFLAVCRVRGGDVCDHARTFADAAGALGVEVSVMPMRRSHRAINQDLGTDPAYSGRVADWITRVAR